MYDIDRLSYFENSDNWAMTVCRSEMSSTIDLMRAITVLMEINDIYKSRRGYKGGPIILVTCMEAGEEDYVSIMEFSYQSKKIGLEVIRAFLADRDEWDIHRVYQTLCHKWYWDEDGEWPDLPEPDNRVLTHWLMST